MADPNWNNGFYYDGLPPHTGMKLARRMFFHSLFDPLLISTQKLPLLLIDQVPNGIYVLVVNYVLLQNQTLLLQGTLEHQLYAQIFL